MIYIKSDFFGKIFETLVPEQTGLEEIIIIQNSCAYENADEFSPLIHILKKNSDEFEELVLFELLDNSKLNSFLIKNEKVLIDYWHTFPEKALSDLIMPL